MSKTKSTNKTNPTTAQISGHSVEHIMGTLFSYLLLSDLKSAVFDSILIQF